ncbi:hypothetical protein D3C83_98830 [compost metagenome]
MIKRSDQLVSVPRIGCDDQVIEFAMTPVRKFYNVSSGRSCQALDPSRKLEPGACQGFSKSFNVGAAPPNDFSEIEL